MSDPWAGNDIPVSRGLGEITWTTADDQRQPESGPDSDSPGRSRWWALIALAVIVLLGVGVVWWSSSDSDEQAETDATTLPDLPDVSAPITTAPATTEPRSTSTSSETGDGLDEPTAEPESSFGLVTTSVIELPPAVAAISEPTELVGVTSDGRLLTLAIPSGLVQTVQLSDELVLGSTGAQVVATPSFALVALGDRLLVVDPTGAIIEVDTDDLQEVDPVPGSLGFDIARQGWIRRTDGSDVAVVLVFGPRGGPGRVFTVDIDGLARPLLDDDDAGGGAFGGRADGVRIVNDAGGSYRVDENGIATRVSDGFTLSAAGDLALQRRCDETLRCSTVVANVTDGTVTPTALGDTTSFVNDPSLSPDGRSVSFLSSDDGFVRVLFDLTTGETVPGVQPFTDGSAWSADSSGEFVLESGAGLAFVPRDGGGVEQIELDLGSRFSFTGIDTRAGETIALPEVEARTIVSSTPLSTPTDLRLFVHTVGGEVGLVDVDALSVATWPAPQVPTTSAATYDALDDTVVVRGGQPSDGGFITRYGQVVEVLRNFNMPDTNAPTVGSSDVVAVLDEGRSLTVDQDAGTTVLRDGATTLAFVGDVVAIGDDTAVVRETNANGDAVAAAVDLTTAERHTLAFDRADVPVFSADRLVSLVDTVSPDGTAALVEIETADEPTRWALVELDDTAPPIEIDTPAAGRSIVWSANGRFAAVVVDEMLRLWDRDLAVVIDLDTGAPLRGLAAVEESFEPDGDLTDP